MSVLAIFKREAGGGSSAERIQFWRAEIFVGGQMKSFAFVFSLISMAVPLGMLNAPKAFTQEKENADKADSDRKVKEKDHEPKPYDKVITAEAKSTLGLFTVHVIKDKHYYEIPPRELGKEFLWVTNIAKNAPGVSYGGEEVGSRVVRWERHDNRVLLRDVSYGMVADPKESISIAVESAKNQPIIMAFNIETFGKDEAPVIEVDKLYATEVQEFSARRILKAQGFDAERSFVERITPYPENIEAESTQTYTKPIDPANPASLPAPAPGGMTGNTATVVMHFSMVKLPESPMQPRVFDERVGYFNIAQYDYGREENKAVKRMYITRWRLEKKDATAALSEPVKPIVFYIDPATPEKWRLWIKKGVEDWQPAFEAAGFKYAILAKDAPTPEEDPNWSPEDVRYSVIRWIPSTTENAFGPHISDPRTGEILNADIHVFHNVVQLLDHWYFVQVGPLDPRAAKLPLPDDLTGRLLEYAVAHEVGHTLGFPHNMKSSSLYPVGRIRDAEWLHKMGHVASIMDYSRFNYVAQAEDHIPPEDLLPRVGPYDKWAVMWGYKPIPNAVSPDAEKPTLDDWTREQDSTPWLRFSTTGAEGTDPGENTEAVGDADAVYSTGMGVKNLKRVVDMVVTATSREGEPYDDLREMYGRILAQWVLEMNHVAVIVGGVDSQEKHAGQSGVIFSPVAGERQRNAVRFLNENAFQTPAYLVRPEILERIEPSGALDYIRSIQAAVLNNLLDDARLKRLIEQKAFDESRAYALTEFLSDVRGGVWTELNSRPIRIDTYRRELQASYIRLLAEKINAPSVTDVPPGKELKKAGSLNAGDTKPFLRAELKTLRSLITRDLPQTFDADTRAHLDNTRDEIDRALDPRFQPVVPKPAQPVSFVSGLDDSQPASCWPDYQIGPF